MLIRGIRPTIRSNFGSSPFLYNKRLADKFKDAYVIEPLVPETNTKKDKRFMNGDFENQWFSNLINRKVNPSV
jgi:hypothetical protein